MKKGKLLVASFGLVGLFLLVPFAQAASSQVWFSNSTEIVWRYTEETLDAAMQVTSLNSSYRKLNFTAIVDNPSNLTVEGDIFTATTADVTAHGYTDQTIWIDEGFGIDVEIEDAELMTKFASYFNELNIDLTDIQSLPSENQTVVMMMMPLMLDPSLLAVLFVYLLAQAFGATFGHNLNSTTINSIDARTIDYDLVIDFSLDDSGHWDNLTYHGSMDLTYGATSNVLLKSICTSTLTTVGWNGTAYETESLIARFTHEIKYPDALVNDYPTSSGPGIPGFPIWILIGAMVLGIIPTYLIVKRKKN
jgi:hypothetical protein